MSQSGAQIYFLKAGDNNSQHLQNNYKTSFHHSEMCVLFLPNKA